MIVRVDAYVKFATIPNNWTSKAAWRNAFKIWKKQRAEAQEGGVRISGKWSDFKVYMNDDHRSDVDKPSYKDVDADSIASGEWDYSKLYNQDDDGDGVDDFTLHMMGSNNGNLSSGTCTSASLLAALEDALSQPQDDPVAPATANSGLFGLMSAGGAASEVTNAVLEGSEDDNDSPPYSATLVAGAKTNAGSPWVAREVHLGSGGAAPSAMVGGFECPLGLLMIETTSGTDGNSIGLIIELVAGSYKGVKAESWA